MKNQKPDKAVIIAAGSGSRIVEETNHTPKTLLPFARGSILSAILKNFNACGITEFIIVVGYKAEIIQEYLKKNDHFGLKITFVMNNEWQRGNGISVLLAEEATEDKSFILSMSDHIVSASAIKKVIDAENTANLLLVDRQINNIFDIDDATKVRLKESQIIHIGKEISDYNGIDCGIFRLNNSFFKAMRKQLKKGKESISAAVEILIENNNMYAVFTDKDDYWLDVDTPQAYKYALKQFSNQ